MPPGKPFPKVTPEQRAAFGAVFGQQAKKDAILLGKDLGRATLEHLQNNPQSVISQVAMAAERDVGVLTMVSRIIGTALREDTSESPPPPAAKPPSGQVIDAEFIDEKK